MEATGLIGPVTHSVPATALFTSRSRKQHGLKAEYFSNTTLEGRPSMTRIDKTVDFRWGYSGVSERLSKNYSVRWSGFIVPSESADHLLGFSGQDGYRLWLDDDLVVEDWTAHRPATIRTRQIHLIKDRAYRLKIEYFQTIRGAEARLMWGIPERDNQRAMNAVRGADLVVLVLGLTARVEGEEMNVHADGFAGGDRTRIDLPAPQENLLRRVSAFGKPTVLVLMNGSALAVNWADENVPAILEAWYPGGEGGTAVAEALAGDFSPAGRLPVTFYKSTEQLPAFDDYSMARRTYRYFDGEPLYPFGFGLSYTSFTYSDPKVNRSSISADDAVTVSVDVTNTGVMEGDEVVQLYLTHRGLAWAPLRSLKGFKRVHLDRGQRTMVSFTLHDRELSIVDEAGVHRIVPGTVDVWVGGGQPTTSRWRTALPKTAGAQTQFTITTSATLPN